jgi:hypothetical protein
MDPSASSYYIFCEMRLRHQHNKERDEELNYIPKDSMIIILALTMTYKDNKEWDD